MNVSRETGLIALTIQYIKNDDIKRLDKALRVMPLEKLKDQHQFLLNTLLSVAAGYNRPDVGKLIVERWKVVYPEQDKISILPRIFLMRLINLPTLSWLIGIYEDVTYVEIMDELAEWDNSPNVVQACNRADQIFGPQPHSTYKVIRDHAVDFNNYVVEEYMKEKIRETSPYAPKPEWVKNWMGGDLMTESELYQLADRGSKKDIPDISKITDDEAVEMLTKGMEDFGISISEIEQAKEVIKEQLEKSTPEQRRDLLKPVVQNLQEKELDSDVLLFRTFGPTHPLVDQDLTLDTPSAKYGGCRMFLCDLFDYDFEYDYLEDWFVGYCEQCLLKIKYRWYALRRPRNLGGWEGCYCSWKCVRDSLLEDGLEPAILQRKLIERFENRINKLGIQDRLPDPVKGKNEIDED